MLSGRALRASLPQVSRSKFAKPLKVCKVSAGFSYLRYAIQLTGRRCTCSSHVVQSQLYWPSNLIVRVGAADSKPVRRLSTSPSKARARVSTWSSRNSNPPRTSAVVAGTAGAVATSAALAAVAQPRPTGRGGQPHRGGACLELLRAWTCCMPPRAWTCCTPPRAWTCCTPPAACPEPSHPSAGLVRGIGRPPRIANVCKHDPNAPGFACRTPVFNLSPAASGRRYQILYI
jgi:hypothetical protein